MTQTKKCPIEELVLDERMQARAALDQGAVDDYAAAYRAKTELPPVEVFLVGDVKYIVDGWHRVAGARAAGADFMRYVVVGTGSADDAIWRALASNKTHGVRRSGADKRRAIRLALDSAIGVEQSSRALAEYLGVSDKLVSEVRSAWEAERAQVRNSAPAEDEPEVRNSAPDHDGGRRPQVRNSAPDRRVGRDGKSYPVRAPKERVVLEPSDEPEDEVVIDASAVPAYGPLLERAAEIVRRARLDVRAVGLDTSFAQGAESGLQSVESMLRYAVPEVCPRCNGARCMHCRDRGWVQKREAEGLRASVRSAAR